jgi:hypothetical protein
VIDPRGLTVTEWCDAASLTLVRYGHIPILQDPREWKQWAFVVMQLPAIEGRQAPGPRGFDDWLEWAIRFNEAVPY